MTELETKEFWFYKKKYTMRQLSFNEDLGIQKKCTDMATGQLDIEMFSKLRIAKCLVEPKMLIDDIGLLPASVGNFLASCVAILNDVIPTEDLKKNQEHGSSTSS